MITAPRGAVVHLKILDLKMREDGLNNGRTARFKIGEGHNVNTHEYLYIIGDHPSTVTSASSKMWMKQEPEGEQIFTMEFESLYHTGTSVSTSFAMMFYFMCCVENNVS